MYRLSISIEKTARSMEDKGVPYEIDSETYFATRESAHDALDAALDHMAVRSRT